MTDIYISSLAFLGKSPEEMIAICQEHGWPLEFSSGMPYRQDMEAVYLNALIKRIPHNYFPAPKTPFVLNLGSSNDAILRQSIDHCKKGLWLAQQSGSPCFSAHAGFCIDPSPNELGKKISYTLNFDKEKNKHIFLHSLKEILKTADELQTDFLFENNVLASFNMMDKTHNPLMCCESKEIKEILEKMNHKRLGLLLDTAHLKVSCQTLQLSLTDELKEIQPFIRAIHHSDNDGLVDNNQPLGPNYWFLPYFHNFGNIIHVIEVKGIDNQKVEQQINILESYGG